MNDAETNTPTYFENITAIVLAGGRSRRMGTDKTQLQVCEKPLIEHVLSQIDSHFSEVLISSNEVERLAYLGFEVIPDIESGRGPLMGIISAISKAKNDLCFVQACDIPQTDLSLVSKMSSASLGFDAVVPQNPDGRLEPLFALYRKTAVTAMEHVLDREKGKVYLVPDHCKTKFVQLISPDDLCNLNTPKDYRTFLKKSTIQT